MPENEVSASGSGRVTGDDPAPAAAPARPRTGPVFGSVARRAGLVWIGVALALTALVGTTVETPRDYLILMPATSGLFTMPAILVSVQITRRVVGPRRGFWRWYLGANIALYAMGSAILSHVVHARGAYLALMFSAVALVVVCDAAAVDHMLQLRWGVRSRLVDLLESALAVVAIGAPGVVVNGDEIIRSEYLWFALLLVVCFALFISVLWFSVVVYVRSPKGGRRAEGVAVALAAVAVVDALLNIEQVASGFALPAVPVLTMNGLAMGLLLLVPLHAQHRHGRGAERLPPQAQIRTGRVIAAVTFGSLPALGAAVLATGASTTSVLVAVVALSMLVALSAVRQLLTFSETRRLYAEVERSAEDRRALLAAVVDSIDADRRRVAMRLHEQASSSYAALAALVPAEERIRRPGTEWAAPQASVVPPALSQVLTDRMAAQAESLRELIGAIRPDGEIAPGAGLAAILQAHVDSLDDAVRPEVTRVDVADGLILDWVTETVALRVVQEAVRNSCQHADARNLRIELALDGDVAVLRVADDGVGFDVDGLVVESGIATMRRFVSFCGGQLSIRSAPGEGTVVEARLGGPVPDVTRPPRLRPVKG